MAGIYIKIFMIIMFITGILLWNLFNISWKYYNALQAFHILGSLVIMLILIIPFVHRHVYIYGVKKKVKSINGWFLGFIFLLITVSGFYLFIVGNRGGDIYGNYSYYLHLYGSFILMFLFFYHIKKSNTKYVELILVLTVSFYPHLLKAYKTKLILLKIDNNISKYHNEDWTSSAKCKVCHNDIFNQWADSNHKNLVDSNPYYMVMEGLAGEVEGDEFRQWCMGCHNPSAVTTGLKKSTHRMHRNFLANTLFEKGAQTLQDDFKHHKNSRLEEGVSCVACHRITKIDSYGNASYTIDLNRKKYAFEDSKSDTGQWLSQKFINSKPKIHKQSYSKNIYKKSSYCASCHDETSPKTGKKIVSTFEEWKKSPYNDAKNPQKHKDCVDCHMTNLKDGKFTPLKGTSTSGGEIKKDIKVHYFSGSNYFLAGLKNKKNREQTIQLLRTSAKLDVDIKNNQVEVGVKNVGAGHSLPTGVADFRELWLDITLKNKDGEIIFSSGKLKKNGNLGKDARPFMKVFGDKDGKPVGLLFWRYEKLLSDTRIKAGQRRVLKYNIKDKKKIKYPLHIVVKLNFRIYPQWVTDAVQKMYPQLPSPDVIVLNKVIKSF